MISYNELKRKHQKEVNEFPFGAAFSNEQLKEMMSKWGLDIENKEDLKKIVSLGAGTFIQKKDIEEMKKMFRRHKFELKEFKKNKKELKKAIIDEMFNIEYCYCEDDERICGILNLDIKDIKNDVEMIKLYLEAKKQYFKELQL